MKHKFFLLFSAFLINYVAHAQWHFTASINVNCGNIYDSQVQLAQELSAIPFNTKQECESARQSITINVSYGGCYARIMATPCTGSDFGGASNTLNVASVQSSVTIGEPYFAPNGAYVVSNTGRDMEIKLEALSKGFNDATTLGVKTGDRSFDDIYKKQVGQIQKAKDDNPYMHISRREIDWDKAVVKPTEAPKLDIISINDANSGNVQFYFDNSRPITDLLEDYLNNPVELEALLKSEFKNVSKYNIDSIRNIWPDNRSKEGQQALADYEAYRVKEMEQLNIEIEKSIDYSQEKKEIDAAILALDSYGDDEEGWLSQTNYKKLDLESLSNVGVSNEHQSILSVAEKINECNNRQSETGFHAELYYNEATNSYVISFRGTEFTDLNDIKTDYNILKNALGSDDKIKQYEMAMEIAEVINKIPKEERDKLNIEVVGHSLGGGLASIVGLETGIETKTYNASMVPDGFLKEKGLYDKVNNGDVQNITAYNTSTDPLTIAQNTFGSPAIGISRDIGDPSTLWERAKTSASGAMVGAEKVGEVGGVAGGITGTAAGAIVGAIGEGHRMSPITRHFFNNNNEKKKAEWDKLHDSQDRLQRELRSAEMRP